MKTKVDIALAYINAINMANIEELYTLMTKNHLFIDAHDNNVKGKENMKQSWIDYFIMFPDYKIEVVDILQKDDLVCILGYASGTYKNLKNIKNSNYWRVPAAWTAIIKDNQVNQWQVYADNIIVMDIINRVENNK